MNDLCHKTQHATRALEFFQRPPARIELIEQFGMNWVSLLQLSAIILVRASLRKIVGVLAVELCELL